MVEFFEPILIILLIVLAYLSLFKPKITIKIFNLDPKEKDIRKNLIIIGLMNIMFAIFLLVDFINKLKGK